jgi:hypothetical protein
MKKIVVHLTNGEKKTYDASTHSFSTRVGSELYAYEGGGLCAIFAPHFYDYVEIVDED